MGSKDWAIQLDVSILFSLFFTYFGMKLVLALGLVTLYLVGCWAAEESKDAVESTSLTGQQDSVSHVIEKRAADNAKGEKKKKVQKKLKKQRRRRNKKNPKKRSKGKRS